MNTGDLVLVTGPIKNNHSHATFRVGQFGIITGSYPSKDTIMFTLEFDVLFKDRHRECNFYLSEIQLVFQK